MCICTMEVSEVAVKTQSFNTRQTMSTNTFEVFQSRDAAAKDVALHHHDFFEVYFFCFAVCRCAMHILLFFVKGPCVF